MSSFLQVVIFVSLSIALGAEKGERGSMSRKVQTGSEYDKECKTGKFICPSKPQYGNIKVVDPNNCQLYYECWNDGAYRYDCGKDKHFNGIKCEEGPCETAKNCRKLDF